MSPARVGSCAGGCRSNPAARTAVVEALVALHANTSFDGLSLEHTAHDGQRTIPSEPFACPADHPAAPFDKQGSPATGTHSLCARRPHSNPCFS
ncbi:hypothetical protein PAPYR_13531 [Paratrimastix pyriformis]|uniref:Uncharacterized protein n=1 Tax=Paratrimastix pyriformis TaxID=342808 RepID=A0ABQ8U085_9EUKA|nr:hypothetical protein PAPYR_13531 [Paratrimastix pyriformis]